MYRHAPADYVCPFCCFTSGIPSDRVLSVPSDIVLQEKDVTAFIGAHQWPNNRGHVLIVPNAHYENLYYLPTPLAARIHETARRVALAMKAAYACSGISTRQHNEPAGNQDVWHYHLHVFPRYPDDNLYGTSGSLLPAAERAVYAARLRDHLPTL